MFGFRARSALQEGSFAAQWARVNCDEYLMAVNKDRKLDVAMSDETLRRAEEMCSGLSLAVSIEKRGHARVFPGALDDLNSMERSGHPVEVLEVPDEYWVTLVGYDVLSECSHALLVYRRADGSTRKLLGRHESSRPGLRQDDPPKKHFCRFFPERQIEDGS